MPFGRLNPQQQVFQASGESTPSAELPDKYVSTLVPESPISDQLTLPAGIMATPYQWPVVQRAERMVGMRYLYARGMMRMPITRNSADGPPLPWISAVQPNLQGPIHNGGFNDALYQAGYPGYNLGLSFKAPQTQSGKTTISNMSNSQGVPININVTQTVNRLRRSSGTPRQRNQPNPSSGQ